MYNYNQNNYSAPTTLGIPERWERVLCYAGFWVTGIIFLLIERRNQTVRRHAAQSTVVFGGLSILGWIVGLLGGALSHIWVVGPVLGFGFGAIGWILGLVTFVAWIGLMILAFSSAKTFIAGPRYERYM
ncbi:MAG TPA: hypothetical protein VFX31_08015 [Ktedonobacterales bacterium]|jgi:uncharacterized membrane protein|nr:hypothetical protein [Ktedonobacterales bacterium]HEX5571316.1 hypothetical protein [Ktedonobacterales bacterium]